MAFTYTGMSLIAHCPEQFATYLSMTDVRFSTMTMDRRGITTEDTQIVQHGSFLQELKVYGQFLMLPGNLQGPVSHLPAML